MDLYIVLVIETSVFGTSLGSGSEVGQNPTKICFKTKPHSSKSCSPLNDVKRPWVHRACLSQAMSHHVQPLVSPLGDMQFDAPDWLHLDWLPLTLAYQTHAAGPLALYYKHTACSTLSVCSARGP